MNSKKQFPIFILFLLVLPIAYSVTLEELIASYGDFDYSSAQMDVTAVVHSGADTGGDALFDELVMDITVDNLAGDYIFIGDLYLDGNLITTISPDDPYSWSTGENTAQLQYNPKLLQNGDYTLNLMVQDGDYLTVFRDDVYTFTFDNADYEKPDVSITIDSHELVDPDLDGKNEILRLNVDVDTTTAGDFEINALIGNGKSMNSIDTYSLTIGTNNLDIDFDGSEIRKERIDDPTLYLISIENGIYYEFAFDYAIDYDLYSFDAEQSMLADTYTDTGIDSDQNDLFNSLNLEIGLDIAEAGTYQIELELNDLHGNYVKKVTKEFDLDAGTQTVDFTIDGTDIYQSKINGPYLVKYIKLIKDDILDSVLEPHTTNDYSYNQFEKPDMPDLLITNLELGNSITITISNNGDSNAFGFNIELFDQDFNKIEEGSIDYLAPGTQEDIILNPQLEEVSSISAIVDYQNNIEEKDESNNLFTRDVINLDIPLSGWTLISLPADPGDRSIASIFTGLSPLVYYFDSTDQDWKYYKDGANNNFNLIDPIMGLWVKVDTPTDLTTQGLGYIYPVDFELEAGWNHISYLSQNTAQVSEALAQVNFNAILTYQNGQWLTYSKSKQVNTLTELTPGYGYWVKVAQDVTWEFDGVFKIKS